MDLHNIILNKQNQIEQLECRNLELEHEKGKKNSENGNEIKRQFFDESLILQEALNEFRGMLNKKLLDDLELQENMKCESDFVSFDNKNAPNLFSSVYNTPESDNNSQIGSNTVKSKTMSYSPKVVCDIPDTIKLIGKITSIKHDFGPNTTLGVGLMEQDTNAFHAKENVYRGRPTLIHTTTFHSKTIQDIALKNVYKLPQIIPESKRELVPQTIEELIIGLKMRLKENKLVLQECINSLAEEHRQSKRWKSQYQNARKCLIDIQRSREHDESQKAIFLNKRQGVVDKILSNNKNGNKSNKRTKDIDKRNASYKQYYPYLEIERQNNLKTNMNEKDAKKYNIKPVLPQLEANVLVYIPHNRENIHLYKN
jgi:hypothetical protein